MLAMMNLASEMMAATSSRPSFLIFQFLSPILVTRSVVILSLRDRREKSYIKERRGIANMTYYRFKAQHPTDGLISQINV